MTYELLDIGLHESQKGINYFKSTQFYGYTDKYVKYDQRVIQLVDGTEKALRFFNDKIYNPIKENLIVFYDQSTNFVSVMVKMVSEHWQDQQEKIGNYIRERYDNVRFFIHKNWLRLDFDCNGKVTKEDLKNNFLEFYEFIKSYEYYQKAMEIKTKLYE